LTASVELESAIRAGSKLARPADEIFQGLDTGYRPGDGRGDGKADILWQNSSTGQRGIWLMNGTTLQSTVSLGAVATSWTIRNY
jgi:hypothetical protein